MPCVTGPCFAFVWLFVRHTHCTPFRRRQSSVGVWGAEMGDGPPHHADCRLCADSRSRRSCSLRGMVCFTRTRDISATSPSAWRWHFCFVIFTVCTKLFHAHAVTCIPVIRERGGHTSPFCQCLRLFGGGTVLYTLATQSIDVFFVLR